jgi:putative CocE/NonD family hydrolase
MNRENLAVRRLGAILCVLLPAPWSIAFGHGYSKTSDVPVVMSDGAALATDVYLPNIGESFPVVLVRTPYHKAQLEARFADPLADHGYAVVAQDVRGQQASAGAGPFRPIVQERQDGLDTLDWIAKQSWCNGRIGVWGSSYNAYCGMILTPEKHPALKTAVNISGWGDSPSLVAPGGAMHLMLMAPWCLSNQIRGKGSSHDYDWPEVFKKVPVNEIPRSIGVDSPEWEYVLGLWNTDILRRDASIARRYGDIRTPILYLTGWNDFVARLTLDAYEGIVDSKAADRGAFQKLIVGPWRHDQYWGKGTAVGDEDFGPAAQLGNDKIIELTLRWFDYWLKGEQTGIVEEKPVRLFVMGSNTWREYHQWPPRTVKLQKWYLDGSGSANGLSGDGYLSPDMPIGNSPDSFVYDPMNPVPTTGGVNYHFFRSNLGAKDQRLVEQRDDVLVYTSPPLKDGLEIIGPIQVVLYASTEGRHTDFTAKLVEVWESGYARIIEDGIKRGPDEAPRAEIEVMEPGKIYRFTIDLGATAISIAKGNRLRVEVSSSNFPKYSRNPNTGERAEFAVEFKTVTQTVFHSREYPSHIVLPVNKTDEVREYVAEGRSGAACKLEMRANLSRFMKLGEWDEALTAVELLIAAEPDNIDLLKSKCQILATGKKDRQATLACGDLLLERLKDDAEELNSVAWKLLTKVDFENAYDEMALKFAERSNVLTKHENWMHMDTLALARFRTGDTLGAIELGRKAIGLCGNECWGLEELQKSLDRYQAKAATVRAAE